MERNEISIADLIKKELDDAAIHELWYDWFCSDKALIRKGRSLISRLKSITKHTKKFDPVKNYVFFKNNCPCYGDGKLYDTFKICDMITGDVIYCITPRNPYGKAEVYGFENNFESALVSGTWSDVKEFFKN